MKKVLLYFLASLLVVVSGFTAFAVMTNRMYLFKAVLYNYSDVDDYKLFENNVVQAGTPAIIPPAGARGSVVLPATLREFLEQTQTIALVVVKNDSLLFEQYWKGFSDSSYSGSFSMAKSIVSLLTGIALQEGLIQSINDPVAKYLPGFSEGRKKEVTIKDLLTMSSGSDWDESYSNPVSVTAEIYYGDDVYKTATGVNIIHKPGTMHVYKSGDTQLLGLLIEQVTGKSLAAYASEKLWKPLVASSNAFWSTDRKNGHEKAYCCFNTNAVDFSRLGLLMLHHGNWRGQQLIDSAYCSASVTPCGIPDASGKPCTYYGYQWWILPEEPEIFMARGILGQYIIVIPSKQMVLVRLGENAGPRRENGFLKLYINL
jgi:CubicO group peptidase (beta-lactamase class C family)